jgi:Uncharacterised protein family (UPF0158)
MTLVLTEGIDSIVQVMNSTGVGMDGWYGYVDRETGEVLVGSSEYPIEDLPVDEDGEIPEELEHRYLPIPNLGSRDGYRDLVDFVATVKDEKLQDLLSVAIQGKGAFGRFKDVLRRSEYESAQAAWFAFADRAETGRVAAWLATEGLSIGTQPTNR